MEDLEKSRLKGIFELSLDKEFQGELTLDGEKSSLCLDVSNCMSSFPDLQLDVKSIKGTLKDGRKVSLLNCLEMGVRFEEYLTDPGSLKAVCNAYFFPHHAVFGNQHISYDEEEIIGVSFVIDDANNLFYDPDIFGTVPEWVDNQPTTLRPLVEQIVQSNNSSRKIEIGEHPRIFYYTGKTQIFDVKTILGKVSASHSPRVPLHIDSSGFKVENKVLINLQFDDVVAFENAIKKALRVLNFFELIVGNPQNLANFFVFKNTEQKSPVALRVYSSLFPKYQRSKNRHRLGILLNPVENPEKFSHVLDNWLRRDNDWQNARSRFLSSCFVKKLYDPDRLIAAANVFDLIPSEAVSEKVSFPEDCKKALEECKGVFKRLLDGDLRKHALNMLGLVDSGSKLKSKIRYRIKYINNKIGDRLPELSMVADEAVNCRNHYVHGSSNIDYDEIIFFLTDTLEFVFIASDLIESGWDIKNWYDKSYPLGHPFVLYRSDYEANLKSLKGLLSSKETNS